MVFVSWAKKIPPEGGLSARRHLRALLNKDYVEGEETAVHVGAVNSIADLVARHDVIFMGRFPVIGIISPIALNQGAVFGSRKGIRLRS
jgi:hypothetical protein